MKSSTARSGLNLTARRYERFLKYSEVSSNLQICRIKYGRIQGLNALIQHFEASSVMNQQVSRMFLDLRLILCFKQRIRSWSLSYSQRIARTPPRIAICSRSKIFRILNSSSGSRYLFPCNKLYTNPVSLESDSERWRDHREKLNFSHPKFSTIAKPRRRKIIIC